MSPARVRNGLRTPVAQRVQKHRKALRAAGLRPIQIWVPDVRSKRFVAQAHRQSLAVANSLYEKDDQAFIHLGHDMKRGDIWTVAGGPGYAGKPRPVMVLQDNRLDATESITICPFTGDPTAAELFRIPIEPTATNGLKSLSRLMVDKITTVAKSKVGKQVGRLDDEDVVRLNRAVVVFLGLAGSS